MKTLLCGTLPQRLAILSTPPPQVLRPRPVRRSLSRSLTTRSSEAGSQSQTTPKEEALADEAAAALTASDTRVTPGPSVSHSREPSPSPSPEPRDESPAARLPETDIPVTSHPLADEEPEEDFFASKELIGELQSDVGQRGEVWFLAQMVGVAMVLFCPFQLTGLIDMLGTLALTAGLVFIVYAVISLGRNLSPLPVPRKKHSLVVSGMYQYVRHPMYGGLLLSALGLACITRSETRLALGVLLWWILEQKVILEERGLAELYPEQYARYQATVKKFVPFVY